MKFCHKFYFKTPCFHAEWTHEDQAGQEEGELTNLWGKKKKKEEAA